MTPTTRIGLKNKIATAVLQERKIVTTNPSRIEPTASRRVAIVSVVMPFS